MSENGEKCQHYYREWECHLQIADQIFWGQTNSPNLKIIQQLNVYCNLQQAKSASPHFWDAETMRSLTFLHEEMTFLLN